MKKLSLTPVNEYKPDTKKVIFQARYTVLVVTYSKSYNIQKISEVVTMV